MNTLELKTLPELPFDVTEALNQLRVNLEFCGSEVKTIMITSSTPNEGKSYVSLNLWRAIANMGHRVLLIDVDIRNEAEILSTADLAEQLMTAREMQDALE